MNFEVYWRYLNKKLDIIITLLERIAAAEEAKWR